MPGTRGADYYRPQHVDHQEAALRLPARGTPAAAATAAVVAATVVIVAAVAGVLPLVLLLVAAVPVVAVVWVRPQRGLLLLVGLLPFDGLLLIAPLPAHAAGWKEALLLVTAVAAFRPGSPCRSGPVPRWPVPLAVLLGVSLVTVAWSPPVQAVVGLKVAYFGMLTAVVAWRCPLTIRDRDRLVTVLLATGTATALVGVVQQVVGHAALHGLGYPYNSVIRFTGGALRSFSTFNQPFPFAFHLMLVVLVVAAVALAEPDRLRSRLALLVAPLLLAGMAAAIVRAAWIGLAVGLLHLAVTRHRRLLVGAPLVVGALAVAVVLGAAGFFASASVDARLSRWETIPAVVAAAPFGEGIGASGAAAALSEQLGGGAATFNPDRVGATRVVFQPDNTYLKVLYDVGPIGLTAFVLLLLTAYADCRQRADEPAIGPLASGTASLLVAAAIAGMASTFFEVFPLDYLVWLLVGVVTTVHRSAGTAARGGSPTLDRRTAPARSR